MSGYMTRFSSARKEAEHFGWPRVLWARLLHALDTHLGLTVCVVTQRPLQEVEPAPLPPNTEVRICTEDEALAIANDPDMLLTPEFVRDAYARGDCCIATWIDGRVIAFSWKCFSRQPYRHGVWIEFSPGHVYSYHAYTHRAFRGRHLRDAQSRRFDREWLRRGNRYTVGYIDLWNLPSRQLARRRETPVVGLAGFWLVRGRAWCFRTRGVQKTCGFRFYQPGADTSGGPISRPSQA
jgi:hypothetical protein